MAVTIINTSAFRFHIGIDPGTNTGVATWDRAQRAFVFVGSMMAVEAEDYVLDFRDKWMEHGVMAHVEDTRNLKMPKGSVEQRGPNAMKNMGQVLRDMSRWEEFLRHRGVPFQMRSLTRSPLRKCTAEYFKLQTGWSQRTSEHGRDAAAYVWAL